MPVVKPACSSDTLDLNPKGARELMSLFPGSCALDFHRRRDTTRWWRTVRTSILLVCPERQTVIVAAVPDIFTL